MYDKTINIKSKSKHINSKTHKHKQKFGSVVKEIDFINSDIDEVSDILNDTDKVCRKKIIFVHLNIDVCMISNLQSSGILKKL